MIKKVTKLKQTKKKVKNFKIKEALQSNLTTNKKKSTKKPPWIYFVKDVTNKLNGKKNITNIEKIQ